MAIWQFVLHALPETWLSDEAAWRACLADEHDFCVTMTPDDLASVYDAVSALLPEARSWGPTTRVWGNDESTDVVIRSDDEAPGTFGICIRLDLSRFDRSLLDAICGIARRHGWAFSTREDALVPATPEAVLGAIRVSRAAHFVRDPRGFFDSLEKEA